MPALMEVLEFLDNSGTTMVKRVPDNEPAEIKWGAQLTVRESQEAVFMRDGQVVDVFKAGRFVLSTNNIPLIGKWVTSFGYGAQSPFRAEVYFVSKKIFTNLKWGTQEPILFNDTELKMVRIRAFGVFAIQIADSRLFTNHIVGTMGIYEDANIADYLKSIIISRLTGVLSNKMKTVLQMPASFDDINVSTRDTLSGDFQNIGLALTDFFVSSISLPEEVQQMIDERSGMSAIGNMDEFMKYKMAMSMGDAAKTPGSVAGQTIGAGLGMGMGFMMPQMMQQAMPVAAASTPEKSPVEKLKDLKGLLDLGIVTQAEFDEKKAKLLEQI